MISWAMCGTESRAREALRRIGLVMDYFVIQSFARLAIPAGRPTTYETAQAHLGSALRDGFASLDGHREIPDASNIQKIVVKQHP